MHAKLTQIHTSEENPLSVAAPMVKPTVLGFVSGLWKSALKIKTNVGSNTYKWQKASAGKGSKQVYSESESNCSMRFTARKVFLGWHCR